jgi:hypothetical protein
MTSQPSSSSSLPIPSRDGTRTGAFPSSWSDTHGVVVSLQVPAWLVAGLGFSCLWMLAPAADSSGHVWRTLAGSISGFAAIACGAWALVRSLAAAVVTRRRGRLPAGAQGRLAPAGAKPASHDDYFRRVDQYLQRDPATPGPKSDS